MGSVGLKVAKGIVDNGLVIRDDVNAGDYIIEYTGNHVDSRSTIVINQEMDTLGINCDRLVRVPFDRATIDPRGCGNSAMCLNHHCFPNS